MKRQDINIRDPFVLVHDNKYYLYGTRSATTWSEAEGFDCYISEDLENWQGPIEIFKRSDDFFATQNFWAPEVYFYKDKFYLVTTLGAKNLNKGIYVMVAEQPTGPFELLSQRLTPENWSAIDGSLAFENGRAYLIFSHSFETSPDGDMCLLELSDDLSQAIGQPIKLFSAGDASWARPIPFSKAEFDMDGDVYFTDGPAVFKTEDDQIYMLWSSWGKKGYAVGFAKSENNSLLGPWKQIDQPLFAENGGHAMVFKDLKDKLRFAYHFPNDHFREHPQFADLVYKNGQLHLENRTDLSETL